ncbi:hypothetical protein [Joostella sp. CR20]|uniref:hypothetical protein n=1 Tax=Joostella sp. CR20 TaxID=2804312 RepID=UPI00313EC312
MSTKKNNFIISCEEAKHICDKMQYGEATFLEKLQLNLRLLWCKATKSYSSKNSKLTDLCNKAEMKTLGQEKKNEMKKKLDASQPKP